MREIARLFRVNPSFDIRLLQRRREADTLEPKPFGGALPSTLGPDDLRRVAELIRDQPDATLQQLKERRGFSDGLKTLRLPVRR